MLSRADFLLTSLSAAAAVHVPQSAQGALDRFMSAPTPEYRYEIASMTDAGNYRTRVFWLVSQRWRNAREVDRPLWTHWLTVTEPKNRKTDICLLVVSGGSQTDAPPARVNPIIIDVAGRTGAVVAELTTVPNEPLLFSDEHTPRSEDDIIAYSWDKFLRTGDETWPLHLPMTKAVVRAMDTLSNVTSARRFIVGGASKRGWTTWLTAAADTRVIGIVPVVIDTLNVEACAQHAHRVYGFWPPALAPYDKMHIMRWLGTPNFDALMTIEDPYSYRKRITVPKLIVNATGDQYFTPDSSQFYFNGLLGEKYLRYLPNTDHSLKGTVHTAVATGKAFVDSFIAGTPRPRYAWQRRADGTLVVQSETEPSAAKLWQAVNPNARDFRLGTIGDAFTAVDLHTSRSLTYEVKTERPRRGFRASFVELTYGTGGGDRFTVTTDVQITGTNSAL